MLCWLWELFRVGWEEYSHLLCLLYEGKEHYKGENGEHFPANGFILPRCESLRGSSLGLFNISHNCKNRNDSQTVGKGCLWSNKTISFLTLCEMTQIYGHGLFVMVGMGQRLEEVVSEVFCIPNDFMILWFCGHTEMSGQKLEAQPKFKASAIKIIYETHYTSNIAFKANAFKI